MKYVFLFLFFVLSLHADNIRWFGSYDLAHQEVLKTHKLLMVFLIEKKCPDSKKMLSTTFMDKEILKIVNKNFVCALITKDQDETYPIELLYTLEYPAIFFLDKYELFIGKNIFGYIDSQSFKKHLNLYFN